LAYQKEYGQLWINLIGREPKGTVSPGEEYNEVREALIKGITEKLIDNESGQPVVERIYKKEELFNGEHFFKMPDLIVTLKQEYGFSNLNNEPVFDESAICIKKTKTYTHGTGIIIGKNIRKGLERKDLAITSIVPSILYCMGCTIPSWLDGKVEEQIFNEDFISVSPPKYDHDEGSAVLSEQDENLIKDRLRGLGYLE
jgi:predicted AlkP superfamily phosphohydrolase/phosphomutase